MASTDGVARATGRSRPEWFALLDDWGAPGRAYREIAGWLREEHGLSAWWAQKLVVEYEQARGIRKPGVRPNGTFEVTASKTVPVPVARAYEAIADGRRRKAWLPDARMSLRGSRPPRSARFDFEDGSTRVRVELAAKGPSKASVAVVHEQLPDAQTAEATKAQWKERLGALASYLSD